MRFEDEGEVEPERGRARGAYTGGYGEGEEMVGERGREGRKRGWKEKGKGKGRGEGRKGKEGRQGKARGGKNSRSLARLSWPRMQPGLALLAWSSLATAKPHSRSLILIFAVVTLLPLVLNQLSPHLRSFHLPIPCPAVTCPISPTSAHRTLFTQFILRRLFPYLPFSPSLLPTDMPDPA